MKTKYFEEFLKEIHANSYMGTDDNMPEDYESWLSEMLIDDVLRFGEEFGQGQYELGQKELVKEGGMNQQKLREWIMKQQYFTLEPRFDGMTAWELAGIMIREGQDTEEPINEKMDRQGDNGDETLEDKMETDAYVENIKI